MVSLASHDGQPPRTQAFSGMGMGGSEDFALRLGTHSDRSAGLGFPGLAKGEVLDQVLPDISDRARATIQGRVRLDLKLQVDPTGTVESAELNGPAGSKYFSEQALKAAKKWQFSAPEIDGRSVASQWLVHFEFTQTATNVRPTQVSP